LTSSGSNYRVGIDIGGTFTDLILVGSDGAMHTKKVLSTPDDYGRGVVAGLKAALDDRGIDAGAVERLVHATTVATNTILEGKGASTALITTRGFRDVLDMRRLRIPEMYTLNYPKPEPLVPRRRRLEVDERMGPRGAIWIALDEASVLTALERIKHENVEAVAISLLHSYANPIHEQRIATMVRDALGSGIYITCSSDILPELREYERTSTTVINAYLGPALRRYFESLVTHVQSIGVTAPLQVMKSDGAIMTVAAAIDKPAYLVESGPAAGVIGAARVTGLGGGVDSITLDMGGTTAKASIVENGNVTTTGDYEVGAGINLSSKLITGGGYALKLPVVDLSEIGAGGGSLVTIDKGGLLHVGPESAGAMPGPVAYDQGGTAPTFTDAMIVLGYLNPDYLVGGGLKLNAERARQALTDQVAEPLDKDLLDTAYGIYQVAGGTMVRAVKAVSTYRGRDPRDFALFAFGGNGPVVATEIAAQLEMTQVVVPLNPGVFSAFGLLLSNIEHEVTRALLRRLNDLNIDELNAIYAELEDSVERVMAGEGYGAGEATISRSIDLRYTEQAHELSVPFEADLAKLAQSFSDEHQRTYGHEAGAESVESVALRVTGQIPVEGIESYEMLAGLTRKNDDEVAAPAARLAYFGPAAGQLETPVVTRRQLLEGARLGPLIIEEYDATCVVPPGWRARVDERGNIELQFE
jgi:N-methylhydantoinase A